MVSSAIPEPWVDPRNVMAANSERKVGLSYAP